MKLEDLLSKPAIEVGPIQPETRFPSDDDYYNEGLKKSVEQFEWENLPEYLFTDPEVVGYPDEEMQSRIYDWVLDDIRNKSSIMDYGCGRGDFYGHARMNGYSLDYTGFDNRQVMVDVGKKKYKDYIIGFNLLNFDFALPWNLEPVDYTICIGTLNDNHGQDKWEYFNRILNNALSNTRTSIIFVLSRNFDGDPNFLDYPFEELFQHLDKNLRFEIDYTKFEDIYKLTVHIGGYN